MTSKSNIAELHLAPREATSAVLREPNPHIAAMRRDFQRYFDLDLDSPESGLRGARRWYAKLRLFVTTPGLHATVLFRYGHWLYSVPRLRAVSLPLKAVYHLLDTILSILWGVHIDIRARIGGGLYLGHADGILIGPVKMGVDCTVGRNVTIGRRADGHLPVPTLGDRVYIGIGSVIFGGIEVGDGVTIAPLTLVGRSLPSAALVAGNPMKVVRVNYDNSTEIYGPSTSDPEHDGLSRDLEGVR